ncbi:hypothetical protein GCM10009527_089560 [Actinomadura nitritigenes]
MPGSYGSIFTRPDSSSDLMSRSESSTPKSYPTRTPATPHPTFRYDVQARAAPTPATRV